MPKHKTMTRKYMQMMKDQDGRISDADRKLMGGSKKKKATKKKAKKKATKKRGY